MGQADGNEMKLRGKILLFDPGHCLGCGIKAVNCGIEAADDFQIKADVLPDSHAEDAGSRRKKIGNDRPATVFGTQEN